MAESVTHWLCELTLEAVRPERLADFYQGLFGWRELSRDDDRIWLACGERCRLGLWSPGTKEFGDEGGRHVHFAVSVGPAQFEEIVERLRAGAIEHEGPVEHSGGDRSIYVRDPVGNVVEAWDFFERGDGARLGVDALASRGPGAEEISGSTKGAA